jgi:hypothetical protein
VVPKIQSENRRRNTDYSTSHGNVDEDANLMECDTLSPDVWIADIERLTAFILRV